MTGIYVRVFRNNKWDAIEIEYLTRDEINELFKNKNKDELISWIGALADYIHNFAEVIENWKDKI